VTKAHMIGWTNDKHYWQPALETDGKERDNAGVITPHR